MKRLAVLGTAAMLGLVTIAAVPKAAHAQLTMQMGNGWTFSFAGNVNAFLAYQLANNGDSAKAVAGGLVPTNQGTNPRIRTGLLPAFAVFDAKGKEGPFMLGVHFGFAPQIQNGGTGQGGNVHDQFGAQIDMRQVYLTVGGDWGTILAGRELGLFARQNILQDMTLFGIGATGGNLGAGGTTLGRIGFGYPYPNFVPQMTYTTASAKSIQWSIGLFDPSQVGGGIGSPGVATAAYVFTHYPRIETELSWTGTFGDAGNTTKGQPAGSGNKVMVWVGGLAQGASSAPNNGTTVMANGLDGGVKLDISQVSIVGSGWYGTGIGSFLLLSNQQAVDATGTLRHSYGGYAQIVAKVDDKWSVGGSFGGSWLKATPNDLDPALLKSNLDGTGEIWYQWTKSLKWVGEADYTQAKNQGSGTVASDHITGIQIATGLMLFF